MRTLIAAAAVAIAGLVGSSPRAEAGVEISIGFSQIYVSDHADCGCPIYTKRVCRGFDRYHRPVFDYYRQPFHCHCDHVKHRKYKKQKKYKHKKHKKHKKK